MSAIFDLVTGLLSGIGGLFTGGLAQLLNQSTENLITVVLLAFAVTLGVFAIVYLNRRRRTLDDQRMAALIKGLHRAGVAHDLLAQPKEGARDHLLRGLRWLFGALGISSAMYGYQSLQPMATDTDALRGALIGLIPAGIGIAHLIFSRLSSPRPARPIVLPRSAASLVRAAAYPPVRRRI